MISIRDAYDPALERGCSVRAACSAPETLLEVTDVKDGRLVGVFCRSAGFRLSASLAYRNDMTQQAEAVLGCQRIIRVRKKMQANNSKPSSRLRVEHV